MNLNLLSYSNYYNREVKKFDTLAEYEPYVVGVTENINFNPGDGVDTTQIVNYDGDINPDYVIITEGLEIISRWFIIDSDFVRRGQVELTLHRDLVADNYTAVINAPCFIEKAMLNDNDVGIFNAENIKVNQIKKSETLLKDETKSGWIVGYIPSDAFPPQGPSESAEDYKKRTTIETSFVDSGRPDITVPDITKWDFYRFTDKAVPPGYRHDKCMSGLSTVDMIIELCHYWEVKAPSKHLTTTKCKFRFDEYGHIKPQTTGYGSEARTDGIGNYRLRRDRNVPLTDYWNYNELGWIIEGYSDQDVDKQTEAILKKVETKLLSQSATIQKEIHDYFEISNRYIPQSQSLEFLQGKTIYDENTHILYKIDVQKEVLEDFVDTSSNIGIHVRNFSYDIEPFYYGENIWCIVNDGGYSADISDTLQYSCVLTSINLVQQKINIECQLSNTNARNHLVDSPYDMFCVPFNEDFEITIGNETIKNKQFAAINAAVAIGAKLGSGTVYDIQLLPYCPMRNAITSAGKFDITNIPHDIVKAPGVSGKKYAAIIWCDRSNFSFDIDYSIAVSNPKESDALDKYRLCAPNYGSAFDFSPAKNGGVNKFNVDCSYKPFNPYIHVNPNFKGLYGADFNDSRGLVCGGDYSLTQLTSAWADYELRNKNYNNSFNLQIDTMDSQHELDEQMARINAVTGVVQAGMMGTIMGGGFGKGGAGTTLAKGGMGLASAGLSAWAAGKDKEIREAKYQLNRSYLEGMFRMNLENIQAIPYALAKTSVMTINNKIFPFIEYYTCSPMERNAFRNQIKYTSMTVNRVGTIGDFLKSQPTFIKGQLIKIHGIDDDFHAANSIAEEISKGIYI